jgi:hypothetical protein
VQATVDATVDVTETVVLGATTTTGAAVLGVLVSASADDATSDSATTKADGKAVLTLDSGVTYDLSVTKTGYASPSGLTVAVGALATQSVGVTLPTSSALRVFGVVSDRVRSVQVLDGATQVGIATDLGAGLKSFAVDGVPTNTLLRVDFRDASGAVLVSRWIQSNQAGNVSIQLDQDAETGDFGTITVHVEVPQAPEESGVATPDRASVRLIENVPAGFYSISADGVLEGESGSCTGTPRTCTVTFSALPTASSSTSLPAQRFTLAIDSTESDSSLVPTGYEALTASFVAVEVGEARTFSLRTVPGAPARPSLTVVPQSASGGSNQRLDVDWSAPSNTGGADVADLRYVVGYLAGTNGDFTELAPTTSLSATITGLPEGTVYEVRVRAENTVSGVALVGSDSEVASTTTADVPGEPTGLNASATEGSLNITWVAPSSGGSPVTSYTVTLADTVRCSGSTATSCLVTGLDASTSYAVTVTATNLVGTSNPVSGNFTTSQAQAGTALSIDSAGVYEARRTGETEGVHVERGWWFRVDKPVTVDALIGPGGVNTGTNGYTMRLRSGGQGVTPSTTTQTEREVSNITGTNGCAVAPSAISVGTPLRLEPGTWYAVTTANLDSNSVSFCLAQMENSLAVFSFSGASAAAPSTTVENRVGPAHSRFSSRDVAVGFRVQTVHND